MELGFEHSRKADLHLVLGSSLTVSPANEMPVETFAYGGKLVICNLQKTPKDNKAKLRIFAKTDDLMKLVMKNLGIEVPPFILTRRFTLSRTDNKITVAGVEKDGTPMTFIFNLDVKLPDALLDNLNTKELINILSNKEIAFTDCVEKVDLIKRIINSKSNCITYDMSKEISLTFDMPNTPTLQMRIYFMGHYKEPYLDIEYIQSTITKEAYLYCINYNPITRHWSIDPLTKL